MAISVNKVYRTVLSIMNKEGRGFLTPDQFNRIGRQVQLDLLERAFFDYNRATNKEKANITNNEYGNIPKNIKEKIDIFSKEAELVVVDKKALKPGLDVRPGRSTASVPATVSTNFVALDVATTSTGSGTGLTVVVTAIVGDIKSIIVKNGGTGYAVGDIITIPQASMPGTSGAYTFPIISSDIVVGNIDLPEDLYRVINLSRLDRTVNFEQVEKSEYTYINSSKLTQPSKDYPIYYRGNDGFKIAPTTLIGETIIFDYIKMPLDPYWGFTTTANSGYQYASSSSRDFEMHQSDEVNLVVKILGYAGVIIKDPSIVQAASQEENKIIQLEN